MDTADETTNLASAPEHTLVDHDQGRSCEPGNCGSATGPLELRQESTSSHVEPRALTSTTVSVDLTTVEETRTTTKTDWTETSVEGTWATSTTWTTETVAIPAPDPTWTTILTSPTTTTTMTTLIPETTTATDVNGRSPGDFDSGWVGFMIFMPLLLIAVLSMLGWCVAYSFNSRKIPVSIAPVEGDDRDKATFGQSGDISSEKEKA